MIVLLPSAIFFAGCPNKQVNPVEGNEFIENDSFNEDQSDTSKIGHFFAVEPLELEQENADTTFNCDQ